MRPLFFCHLPKTGGTSLRLALERAFPEHAIVPDRLMMARQAGHYAPPAAVIATMQSQHDSIRMVRGHYHISLADYLKNPIRIAVLREPIARTVSNLKHIARRGFPIDNIHQQLDAGKMPIEDNLMTRYLGVDPMINVEAQGFTHSPITAPDEMLSSAIRSLEYIEYLGSTDRLDNLTARLAALFGDQLPTLRRNVSPESLELNLTDRQMRTIRDRNQIDLRLYDAARLY